MGQLAHREREKERKKVRGGKREKEGEREKATTLFKRTIYLRGLRCHGSRYLSLFALFFFRIQRYSKVYTKKKSARSVNKKKLFLPHLLVLFYRVHIVERKINFISRVKMHNRSIKVLLLNIIGPYEYFFFLNV